MKEIPLTQGKVALVDDEDYPQLSDIAWYCHRGYAVTSIFSRKTTVLMHRLILLPPEKLQVDHINHNKLDNRRANLRLATQTQQNGNRLKFLGTSRFKGVSWRNRPKCWLVQCHQTYVGSFEDEIEAAKAYNAAALKYWGDFAHLNEF